jgi:hypothetical protein
MGGQLVHRVGAELHPLSGAEAVRLLQDLADVAERHRLVGGALRPAVSADRLAAHHLDEQVQRVGHRVQQYPLDLVTCQATCTPPPTRNRWL